MRDHRVSPWVSRNSCTRCVTGSCSHTNIQPLQDRSLLINFMIFILISKVGLVTRVCKLGGIHLQKRLDLWCPQVRLLHWVTRNFSHKNYRDSSCTLALENVGPVLHPAIFWRDDPSVVTSHPGTQQVQEFLLNQGGLWWQSEVAGPT